MTSVVPRMGHRSVWRPMIHIALAARYRFDPEALKMRVIERHTRRIGHQSEIGNLKMRRSQTVTDAIWREPGKAEPVGPRYENTVFD